MAPYQQLAFIIGDVTGERLRQLAESELDTSNVVPVDFETFIRPVKRRPKGPPRGIPTDEEKNRMRELAAIAAKTTRADGSALGENPAPDDLAAVEENLAVRKASEELSALIIGAKRRNVIWADID